MAMGMVCTQKKNSLGRSDIMKELMWTFHVDFITWKNGSL